MVSVALLFGVAPFIIFMLVPLIIWFQKRGQLRRMRRHALLRPLLVDGSTAAAELDNLLGEEAKQLSERNSRSVDAGTLVLLFLIALIGGGIAFGLVVCAQILAELWVISAILWVVAVVWTVFICLLVGVGAAPDKPKGEGEKDESGRAGNSAQQDWKPPNPELGYVSYVSNPEGNKNG